MSVRYGRIRILGRGGKFLELDKDSQDVVDQKPKAAPSKPKKPRKKNIMRANRTYDYRRKP